MMMTPKMIKWELVECQIYFSPDRRNEVCLSKVYLWHNLVYEAGPLQVLIIVSWLGLGLVTMAPPTPTHSTMHDSRLLEWASLHRGRISW